MVSFGIFFPKFLHPLLQQAKPSQGGCADMLEFSTLQLEFRNSFFSWVTCMKENQFPVGKKKRGGSCSSKNSWNCLFCRDKEHLWCQYSWGLALYRQDIVPPTAFQWLYFLVFKKSSFFPHCWAYPEVDFQKDRFQLLQVWEDWEHCFI